VALAATPPEMAQTDTATSGAAPLVAAPGTPGPGAAQAGNASSGSGPGSTGNPDGDARLLAAIHARLLQAAGRCAPPAVKRFGARGETLVSFCLSATGGVTQLKVPRPSGTPVLDEAATGCVVPGAAPFPAEAAGRCFEVPVRF
jgi:TonB family protein